MRDPALDDDVEARWRELASEVLTGFRAWREAHPTASLTEMADRFLLIRWCTARALWRPS